MSLKLNSFCSEVGGCFRTLWTALASSMYTYCTRDSLTAILNNSSIILASHTKPSVIEPRSFPATPSWRPQRSTTCSEHLLALWEVHASHQVYVARVGTQTIIALVVLHVEKPAVALFERFIQPCKRLFFVAQTHVNLRY